MATKQSPCFEEKSGLQNKQEDELNQDTQQAKKKPFGIAVFIAISIDGFIADSDGSVDFLTPFQTGNNDSGYGEFFKSIDAMVMGRKSYETVCSFDCDWPYKGKTVIVLSSTLNKGNGISKKVENESIEFFNGDISKLIHQLSARNSINKIYIDGGQTIQQFMQKDLVDSMILSTIPVVLGGGVPYYSPIISIPNKKCLN